MTIWLLAFLVGFNLVIGLYVGIGGYVAGGGDLSLRGILSATPLAPMVAGDSALSGGLGGWNPLSALAFAWDAMTVLWNMASFNYEIFQVDGLMGDFGDFLLTLVGRAIGVWLLYQFGRSIAGAAGFAR